MAPFRSQILRTSNVEVVEVLGLGKLYLIPGRDIRCYYYHKVRFRRGGNGNVETRDQEPCITGAMLV